MSPSTLRYLSVCQLRISEIPSADSHPVVCQNEHETGSSTLPFQARAFGYFLSLAVCVPSLLNKKGRFAAQNTFVFVRARTFEQIEVVVISCHDCDSRCWLGL
ncbi:hypothetical protein JTE90_014102 [Oedothorax gibbosus]|uniref:Uncharacterized protein n=1 Tax=Oedothorax gibbosus TaxID=931172 RepID=A0AAV6V6P4_9ARAC|nr:hypothetical protein JTE90_014102 [Oedothorax gibbosus]